MNTHQKHIGIPTRRKVCEKMERKKDETIRWNSKEINNSLFIILFGLWMLKHLSKDTSQALGKRFNLYSSAWNVAIYPS